MSFIISSLIVGTGLIGLVWAWHNYSNLKKMDVEDIGKIDEERLLKT